MRNWMSGPRLGAKRDQLTMPGLIWTEDDFNNIGSQATLS